MLRDSKRTVSFALIAAGVGLVCFAALVPNSAIERFLLGTANGTLAWGPTFFRALLAAHGAVLLLVANRWARHRSTCAARQHGQERSNRTAWLILAVLTLVALGLRAWKLNSGLWFDEVLALLEYVRPPLASIVTTFDSQNQHMLSSILAHVFIRAFGESAWALRLPSVVFGVASFWALFLLGRRLLGNLEGLLVCALMAVSYHHIWFSQNARGYMGLLLFATLATWLWFEALSREGFRWWALYAVTLSLGFWTHLTMVFVPAAHGVIHLLMLARSAWGGDRRCWRISVSLLKPLLAWALAASLTLQFYALSLPQFIAQALHEGVATKSEWTARLWWLKESLAGLQIGWSGTAVVASGGVLTMLGWISMFRRDWRAALALVLPAVLGAATMLTLSHPLWPRFFFFSMGFGLLIAVHGAITFGGLAATTIPRRDLRARVGTAVGVALTALMIAASILTLPRYYALPKQDFIGARDYVESNRRPGDAVVAVGLAAKAYGHYFAPHWLGAYTQEELQRVRHGQPNLWLVYTIPAQIKSLSPQFWQEIERDFTVVRVFPGTLRDGDIFVCLPATHARGLAHHNSASSPAAGAPSSNTRQDQRQRGMWPLRIFLVMGLVTHKAIWELHKPRSIARTNTPISLKTRVVRLVKISILLGIIVQTIVPRDVLPITEDPLPLRVVGTVIYTVGLLIAVFARLQLGRNWSDIETPGVGGDQEVVSRGIYRYIRHPIYVGDLLLLFGLELALNSWLVVAVIALVPIVLRRAILEERLLSRQLPGYDAYLRRTKRFIPFIA